VEDKNNHDNFEPERNRNRDETIEVELPYDIEEVGRND
jgi:hypothetical protein